jgi:hypothetical protein
MATNKAQLISMAKAVTDKALKSDEPIESSPELLAAIQSAAHLVKQASGGRADIAELVDQVNDLVRQAEKK